MINTSSPWKDSCWRYLTTKTNSEKLNSGVYISTSQDIYENLAFEDWIYENTDMRDKAILLMWRNNPAVVIGRHQNTWAEVNIKAAQEYRLPLVRRKSGGGTVYHDLGNLNISFFSTKKAYSRRPNLELVADVLRKEWNLDVAVTERDDIILDNKYKISGTAAKLGTKVAYHHFTLLLDVNTPLLHKVLMSDIKGIQTKATESVKAIVRNLVEVNSHITFDRMVNSIAQAYSTQFLYCNHIEPIYVDPTDEVEYPGISSILDELKSWEWTFAKTPKFRVERAFLEYIEGLGFQDIEISIEINKGRIENIGLKSDSLSCIEDLEKRLYNILHLQKFCVKTVTECLNNFITHDFDAEAVLIAKWVIGLVINNMIGNS